MNLNSMLIRNLVFPYMEYFKGNKIRSYLKYLQETQRYSENELKSLQEEKLRSLLLYSIDKVPAYSKYRHLYTDIMENPFSAITKLPILTKQDFSHSSLAYISNDVKKEDLIPNRTGGSTGEPVQFYLDRKTVEFYEAARWRGLSWSNIKIGDSSAMIWGSPIELTQQQRLSYKLKERFFKNRILISAYNLNPSSLKEYIKKLNSFKPMYIYGYASALYLFAELMLSSNLSLKFKPVAVVSTAETLYDFQREKIENAFKSRVINEYGARDGGILAYQCSRGNMHLTVENAYIEIVDVNTKQPVPPGSSGLVIVTDLNNYSMPRIRYQLGDVATLSLDRCDCGVQLPLLEKIEGREDDIFVATNGAYVHGHVFNHIARNLNGIKQFQIIQHSRSNISLKIIRGLNYDDLQVQQFINEIKKVMGSVEIKVEFVESIEPSNSGKIRYTKREFPLSI